MASPAAPSRYLHFAEQFESLTGHAPYPWQESLFLRFLEHNFPSTVNLPTGTGKTSIMAIWLLALVAEASMPNVSRLETPRRLVWIVDRRVVVDQATS